MPKYEKEFLQATTIRVHLSSYDLTIAAVYCPPRHNIKKDEFDDFFSTLGPKFIAGGDYNSKHTSYGSRLITPKGRQLVSLAEEKSYSFLTTGTPTYWPTDANKIPDLLDFFVTNGISPTNMDISSSYDLSSDHSPIIATVSSFIIYRNRITRLHNSRTNWENYRMKVDYTITSDMSLKTPEDIEIAVTNFNNIITKAIEEATPNITLPTKNFNISEEIKELIALKRRARAIWHQTHSPADKNKLNRATNRLKSKIKEAKEISFHNYVSNLKRSDNSIWKPIKNRKKPTSHIPPVRNQASGSMQWARTNDEKAKLFAEHLTNVFTPNDDNINNEIELELQQTPSSARLINPFKIFELQDEIKRLNVKKAAGVDKITPKMIKELPEKGVILLRNIFNAIIRLNYWPKQFKTAEIIVIPKPGKDPNCITSYRPISLLPVVSKILERLILGRIINDPNTEEWIPQHQFGFRPEHSTVQQVHRVAQEVNKALEGKKYCTAAFLDVSQAFDKVWHSGLLYKIKKLLPTTYFNLLRSYLTGRQSRVRVNDNTSDYFPITSGVPQGSVLGPLLYLLYTADFPTHRDTTTGTFADDAAILASHEDPVVASQMLQNHLTEIQKWSSKWKIKINETKSVQVNFSLKKEQCPRVHLNNTELPESSTTKYLGIHLDKRLTWKQHIIKKRKQIDIKVKELNWLIGRRSKLSLENKLLIYKTIIIPIWSYGIELWGCSSKSNISIIQRSQSKLLRMITNAPWYVTNETLHTDLKVPYVSAVIQDRSSKHHSKLESHPNAILQPLTEPQTNRRLKRNWPEDLKGS